MQRRLILMRHAKSSWKDAELEDHERPLNKRGRKSAPKVAVRLVELGWVPERVLSSDSVRTRQTWELMAGHFVPPPEVEFRSDLYHGSVDEVETILREFDPAVRTVLLLGHNPGWEAVAEWLTERDLEVKTGAALLLEARGDTWSEPGPGGWRLEEAVNPKEL